MVDYGVVLGEADLACVHDFAPEESTGCEADVGVFGDDGGVATSQLETDWC